MFQDLGLTISDDSWHKHAKNDLYIMGLPKFMSEYSLPDIQSCRYNHVQTLLKTRVNLSDHELVRDVLQALRQIILQLCFTVMQGNLNPISAATFLKDISSDVRSSQELTAFPGPVSAQDPESVASLTIDALWIADQDISLMPASVQSVQKPRLIDLGKIILAKNFIPDSLWLERLEPEFLGQINLVVDPQFFQRRYIRANTSLYYKQNKFNLLREESEGYAKLVVQVTEFLPKPLDVLWAAERAKHSDTVSHYELKRRRKQAIIDYAKKLNRDIASLIGYFDLDPNRVLDIILDIFTANLTDCWDFFLELLLNSPWVETSTSKSGSSVKVGREVISQIMGFKLSHYGGTVDDPKPTPSSLLWMTAILIRHNLVQLDLLYPHLHPSDEAVDSLMDVYQTLVSKNAKKAGRFAGPQLTGSLDDDQVGNTEGNDSSSKEAAENEKLNAKLATQKGGLVSALIAIGDLTHARQILDRIPQLSQMYSDIGANMCRLLNVIVEPVYSQLNLFESITARNSSPSQSVDSFTPPINSLNPFTTPSSPEQIIFGKKASISKAQFFYENWKELLPKVNDFTTLLRVLRVLLLYVGSNLHRDVALFTKLIRIGVAHVQSEPDNPNVKNSWLNIISNYFFPGLSHTTSNPGLSRELWKLVSLWPYETRYALYGEWKHATYKKIPDLKIALMGCEKDCRYIMARLSKETVKQYGRHIGKVVHSNPVICFSYIIKQLESYDNMIPHVVDASRYLTPLEFDVFSYCLIEALANQRASRVEENGTTFALWLKALSSFAGAMFRRHPIELSGILHYIMNQLISDNVFDLLVLQELISNITGIKPLEDATENQLDALAGGNLLKRESLLFESHRVTKKPTERLVNALLERKLALPIGILIAQNVQEVTFQTESDELKILGFLVDHCQKTFLQYFDFISSSISDDIYRTITPSLVELVEDYKVPYEHAFSIIRPCRKRISSHSNDVEMVTGDSSVSKSVKLTTIWDDGSEEAFDSLTVLKPLQGISKSLFLSFWQLSLYDIHVPKGRYAVEIEKQNQLLAQINDDRSELGSLPPSKRKREREKIEASVQELTAEEKLQEANHSWVQRRIKLLHDEWKIDPKCRVFAVSELLQNCIYVRCLLSPADAIFSAKFIVMLHQLGVDNLSTLGLYDRIFNLPLIGSAFISLTETEAKHFGLFLSSCLQFLTAYREDEEKYKAEVLGENLPGFVRQWPEHGSLTIPIPEDIILSHEKFNILLKKWHHKILKSSLDAMKSNDYVQIRNAILIVDKISEFFPMYREMGTPLERIAKKLEETETRQDLKQLARSYWAKLQSRRAQWSARSSAEKKRPPAPVATSGSTETGDRGQDPVKEDVDAVSGATPRSVTPVDEREPSAEIERTATEKTDDDDVESVIEYVAEQEPDTPKATAMDVDAPDLKLSRSTPPSPIRTDMPKSAKSELESGQVMEVSLISPTEEPSGILSSTSELPEDEPRSSERHSSRRQEYRDSRDAESRRSRSVHSSPRRNRERDSSGTRQDTRSSSDRDREYSRDKEPSRSNRSSPEKKVQDRSRVNENRSPQDRTSPSHREVDARRRIDRHVPLASDNTSPQNPRTEPSVDKALNDPEPGTPNEPLDAFVVKERDPERYRDSGREREREDRDRREHSDRNHRERRRHERDRSNNKDRRRDRDSESREERQATGGTESGRSSQMRMDQSFSNDGNRDDREQNVERSNSLIDQPAEPASENLTRSASGESGERRHRSSRDKPSSSRRRDERHKESRHDRNRDNSTIVSPSNPPNPSVLAETAPPPKRQSSRVVQEVPLNSMEQSEIGEIQDEKGEQRQRDRTERRRDHRERDGHHRDRDQRRPHRGSRDDYRRPGGDLRDNGLNGTRNDGASRDYRTRSDGREPVRRGVSGSPPDFQRVDTWSPGRLEDNATTAGQPGPSRTVTELNLGPESRSVSQSRSYDNQEGSRNSDRKRHFDESQGSAGPSSAGSNRPTVIIAPVSETDSGSGRKRFKIIRE